MGRDDEAGVSGGSTTHDCREDFGKGRKVGCVVGGAVMRAASGSAVVARYMLRVEGDCARRRARLAIKWQPDYICTRATLRG